MTEQFIYFSPVTIQLFIITYLSLTSGLSDLLLLL